MATRVKRRYWAKGNKKIIITLSPYHLKALDKWAETKSRCATGATTKGWLRNNAIREILDRLGDGWELTDMDHY